jgi:PAS domain S-box-containing protein
MSNVPHPIDLRALLVEDSEIDAELLLRELRRGGFNVVSRRVQTARALEEALRDAEWDIVLSDYKMPEFNGMEALAVVKASGLDLPFILISGAVGEEIAVAAMRAGANDYFVKRSLARLPAAINRELREAGSRRAFRASEARVRQLFHAVQQAPVSFVITDVQGRIEYVNPKFTQLTGYSLDEVRGQNPRILKSGHQGPEVYRELWKSLHAGNEWRGELLNRAKDGSFFWELASISPIRDDKGRVTHYLAAKLDITEQRQAAERERQLASDRDRLLAQLQQQMAVMPIACIIADRELRIQDWNAAAEKIFGFSKAEMVGRTPYETILPENHHGRIHEMADRLADSSAVVRRVDENRTKDGRTIICEWHNTPLFDAAGQPIGVLAMAQDITERVAATQKMEQQAALLDTTNDAIYVRGLDGRIRFWSRGAERLYGWTREEAQGRTVSELNLQEMAAEAERNSTLQHEGAWSGEQRQMTKAGQLVVVFSSLTLVKDEHGQPSAVYANNTDITAKKRLEEQFLRAQRLESIGMLAAGIAHDLNNVLAPILMGVPLLRDVVKSEADVRLLSTLEKSAERGAGLVKQILGFVHGIGGEPRLVQVKHLLRDVATVIKETFPKSIALEDQIPRDLWPILANPTQIHQIVLNLCVNARDAMPDGGTLRLRAENLLLDEAAASRLEGARAGAWIMLHVEDTGTGIPPEVLAHMWEPFFTTKAAGKGTGLGLATVRGIVSTHHGFSSVETSPDQGTTFRIYLPAADPTAASNSSGTGSALHRGDGQLILVVDDEETIRTVSSAILKQFGYRVLTAVDGTDAVAQFMPHAQEVALVITDVDMPNLGGAGLAQILHRINPQLKILAMSGLASKDQTVRPVDFAAAFIEKPFSVSTFLEFVHRLLQGDERPPG